VDLPPAEAPATVSANASLSAVKDTNQRACEANASVGRPAEGKASNSRMQPSMGDNEFSSVDIYELLISAVLAMFSYHLARSHNYLPLNSRTFLAPAAVTSISSHHSDFEEIIEPSGRSTLVTMEVRLTDMGTLLVTSSVASCGISRLRRSPWDDNSWLQPAWTELRLSPGGQIAKYIGPTGLRTDNMLAERAARSEQPGMDVPTTEALLEDTWKARVTSWLAGKGIRLTDATSRDWLKVLTTSARASTADNGISSQEDPSDESQFLWPRELCYTPVSTQSECFDAGVESLQVSDECGGMHDPLSFAEHWFKSKLLREDQLEAARSTRQVDELFAERSRVSEAAIFDNNSMDEPYIRVVNYLDLHAAGTIYPTPPDGAHTQGSIGAHISNEIGSTPDNGDVGNFDHSAGEGASNEHGLARSTQLDQGIYESDERRRSDASQIAMLSAGYDASNADMFGDMDEDMFGTSRITEADFSFFDEPDLEDAGDQIFDSTDATSRADQSSNVGLATQSAPEGPAAIFPNLTHSDPRSHEILSRNSIETYEQNANNTTHDHLMDQEAPVPIEANVDPNRITPLIANSADEETEDVEGHGFPSPPLSPVSVRKKLLPRLEDTILTQAGPQRAVFKKDSRHCTNDAKFQAGVFGRVPFARSVDFSDRKYRDDGRFSGIPQEDAAHQESRSRNSHIPRIGFPTLNRRHSQVIGVDRVSNISFQDEDTALDSDVVSEFDGGLNGSVFGTQGSIADDIDYKSHGEDASVIAGFKRKRNSSDGENAPMEVAPLHAIRQSPIYDNEAQTQLPSLSRFLPNASALPLTRPEPRIGKDMRKAVGLSDDEYIHVAQILTDQVVSSSLGYYAHVTTLKNGLPRSPTNIAGKEEQAIIGEVIRSIFPASSLCDLETYSAIEETTWEYITNVRVLHKHPRWAKTGGDGSGGMGSHISKLNAPHIRVQRAETAFEVLSTALPFWETLGFGPVNGTKDVRAFCICPPMQGLEDAIDSFLEGLSSAYESCKLGSHTRGEYPNNQSPGLVPIAGGEANPSLESTLKKIVTACEELGRCTSQNLKNRLTPI